jgi:hypothetical protein
MALKTHGIKNSLMQKNIYADACTRFVISLKVINI